jgi:PAS domain S-box-containing protein
MVSSQVEPPSHHFRQRQLACAGLALVYVIAGRLGLLLAVPPGYATAIFPPAGIAVAGCFIAGRAAWPWTFLGSLLLNLWVGADLYHQLDLLSLAVATAIAVASMAQAALGGAVLRRLIHYPNALDNGRDLLRFFASAPVICLTSASLSLSVMAALGAVSVADLWRSWLTWWIGDTLGVLLFLPLVMVAAGEPRGFWRRRATTVALPMLLFFALFVAIFIRVRAWEHDQSLLAFRLQSQQIVDRIQARLGAHEAFLQQLRASFAGPAALSQQDFAALVEEPLQRFAGAQAIEWAPRIEAAQRDDFEAAQRRGTPEFEIRERDASGALHRAGNRAEYYPVTYLRPVSPNEVVVGFDLASEPLRRAAIIATVASGNVIATAPIRLLQQPGDQTGMLVVLAVPRGPNGPGIVLSALRMGPVIDELLGPAREEIGLQFIDQATGQPLFDGLSPGASAPLNALAIRFGERTYSVRTAPTARYFTEHRGWQSWLVLMIGVLSTSLLGALLMLSTGEQLRFARLLSERTRERDRIWQVSEDLLGVGNFAGYFTSVNPAWTVTLGWSEDEIKTIHVNDLRHPDDAPIGIEGRRRLAEGVGTVRMENRFRHKDGSYRWIYWTMTAEQGLIYVIGRNVTADKQAAQAHRQTEDQLRQLQKMDSVGQLTGGIAHDFNNLLTVVIGNLDILSRQLDGASERAKRAITAAMSGASRAATLTQRLLAFAQKQPLRPRAVDLNELATGMAELIRRTQGETIHYDFSLGANLPPCFCDGNQLETALLNLVINARDAMPEGGRLKVETANTVFDGEAAGRRGLAAGAYLMLAVSDTGIGMTPETVERAFEPFFTTKGLGKGTGLGLSMVYGFVKQSNGHVEIDSAPGRGTTVRIFLPAMAADEAPRGSDTALPAARSHDLQGRNETVLLVEDDTDVRGYVAETLRELNYRVIEAYDSTEALAVVAKTSVTIDLLLTDVVMPGLNGRELANRTRTLRPGLKILFMTGYSQDAIVHQGRLDPDIELMEKPFGRETLAARVRAMLDADVLVATSAP